MRPVHNMSGQHEGKPWIHNMRASHEYTTRECTTWVHCLRADHKHTTWVRNTRASPENRTWVHNMSVEPLRQSPLHQAPCPLNPITVPRTLYTGVGPCQDRIKDVDMPVYNYNDGEKVLGVDVLQEAWHCLPLPEARLSKGPCTQTSLSLSLYIYMII